MNRILTSTVLLLAMVVVVAGSSGAQTIVGDGLAVGGSGVVSCDAILRDYVYRVVQPNPESPDSIYIGTDDPDLANYTNICMPANWTFSIVPISKNDYSSMTPHNRVSPGPDGTCAYSVFFENAGGTKLSAVPLDFGFNHSGYAHDVDWRVAGFPEGTADWSAIVGSGTGPVHGPASCDSLCEIDVVRIPYVCLAGNKDYFATADGPEPAFPGPDLLTLLGICSSGPLNTCNPGLDCEFDCSASNKCFGHTFTGCWDTSHCVVAAELCFKVAAVSNGGVNDNIFLSEDGHGVWGMRLSTLQWSVNGDSSWGLGDTLEYCLDLANLPFPSAGVTNVLGMLLDGDLDVYIQDETTVDFLELTVEVCCDSCWVTGDVNGDGVPLTVSDYTFLINYLYAGGDAPLPLCWGDLDGNGFVEQGDVDMFDCYFQNGMSCFPMYPVLTDCDVGTAVPPIAACVALTLDADSNCTANGSVDNGSYDPDGGSVTLTQIPGGPYPLGSTTVQLVATDDEGDADTCTASITVVDNSPPVIECIDTVSLAGDTDCNGTVNERDVLPLLTISDNCTDSADLILTLNPAPGTLLGLGSHQAWLVAVDESGNKDSCTFSIVVIDTTPPVLTCPGDITVSNDLDSCGAIVDLGAAVVCADACGCVDAVWDPPYQEGQLFPVGTTPVELIVTDAAGNADTCTFDVTVNDTQPPVIDCPPDTIVLIDPGQTNTVVAYGAIPITDDQCGKDTATVTVTPPSGSTIELGTTVVEIVATDQAGNADTCWFLVEVRPNIPTVGITSIDPSQFPEICTAIEVLDKNGEPISDWDPDSFCVFQDEIVLDSFEVYPISLGDSTTLCLVISVSESMAIDSKIDSAKAIAHAFVNQMNVLDRVAIVSYADCYTIVQELTSDTALLHSQIDSLTTGGAAAAFDGIWAGVELLAGATQRKTSAAGGSGPKAVVVLSDGMENHSHICDLAPDGDGDFSLDSVLIVEWSVAEDIPIYTITLGDSFNPRYMIGLANGSGGDAYHLPTPLSPLSGIDRDILEKIHRSMFGNYEICYESPDIIPDGDTHVVAIGGVVPGQGCPLLDSMIFPEPNLCVCPHQGDINANGFIDSVDLSNIVDIVFFGDPDTQDPGCPVTRGDFNADGFTDSVDLSLIIDYVFLGGPAPADPCAP